jgi:hypothetical protein
MDRRVAIELWQYGIMAGGGGTPCHLRQILVMFGVDPLAVSCCFELR